MGKILLVDDEEAVRATLAEMLRGMGHEVQTAADGNECLRALEDGDYDLLITDIVMPEQGGLRTIDGAVQLSPQIKILAISGGGNLLDSGDYLSLAENLGAHATMQKPFRREELRDMVNELLYGSQPE